MTEDEPYENVASARRRAPRATSQDLRRIAESIASLTARPELLSSLRLVTAPDDRLKAALASVMNPASELTRSLQQMQAAAAGIRSLARPFEVHGLKGITDSLTALGAPDGAFARAVRGYAALDQVRFSALASGIQANQDQWNSVARILKQYRANHEAITAAASKTLMGGWAASLALNGPHIGLGRSLSETAAVLASARVVVDDASLWASARGLSTLMDGISSIAGSDVCENHPTEALVSALEREAARAEDMVTNAEGGAATLFSIEYIQLVMTLIALVLSALSLANDVTQPDHGPAVIGRLERIADSLGKSTGKGERDLRSLNIAVSKRSANIRQGPTTQSAVVGRFAPGDRAIIIGRTKTWVEIELVEPFSGVVTRGWVYGKLVEPLAMP